MILHVISVAFERKLELQILINCFLIQTNPDWKLTIIHDGTASVDLKKIIYPVCGDPRIAFRESEERYGKYGHPNRKMMLEKLEGSPLDFVLLTNDDNYYVPVFVEYMMFQLKPDVGMVYCDSVHSHFKYDHHHTQVKKDWIDIGSFIVRKDVAQAVGFNGVEFNSDGTYAESCADKCRSLGLKIIYIPKPLFIHN